MGLFQLAPEILIEILLYLDVSDAYAIQSVNHFLNNIYEVSLELQYALECKVAHVRDNPNCHLPIGDRLRMLRDREAAWRSLEPTLTRTISFIPKPSPYLFLNGVLPAIQRDHYLLFDSSTAIRSVPIREFHENNTFGPFEMHNLRHICCCLEEHDLIAGLACSYISHDSVEVRIELIQHSTGTAHPLAVHPTIIVCITRPRDTMPAEDCAMEVFGENLALTIDIEYYEWLFVFDWMTGRAKCEPFCLSNTAGIIVLDEDLILVPDYGTWSLHIYHIPSSSTGGSVKLICRLCLPELYYSINFTNLSWIKCQSAPNPTRNDKFPKYVPSSVPFIDDSKTALIQITWSLWNLETVDFESRVISLVVHRHSIINLLPPSNNWSTITTPDIIDWETWGPSITHWFCFPCSDFPFIINIVHGQYIILPISSDNSNHEEGNVSGAALVKDFNKYHARRFQGEKGCNDFEHPMLKSDLIKNTLPFCQKYLPIQYKCDNYSITDGLILGLNRTDPPVSHLSALLILINQELNELGIRLMGQKYTHSR